MIVEMTMSMEGLRCKSHAGTSELMSEWLNGRMKE
jgi:hypothetical protein